MAKSERRRLALITGAAGGIGRALAVRFARDGHDLVLTDLGSLDSVAAMASEHGATVYQQRCDLDSDQAIAAFQQWLFSQVARVDILVNNAAYMTPVPFEQLELDTFRRYLRINLEAAFLLIKACVPGMSANRWGRILNMVSSSAWHPPPAFTAYITTKMALVGLTRQLATELGGRGITVNALTPSLTRHFNSKNELPESMYATIAERQAIKRVATPEDVVGAASFLVSDDAAFMTGQTVSCDGGMVML